MHYKLLLVTHKQPTDWTISRAMAPYFEGDHANGKWDWYQVGGRYTGALDGYDPEKDQANIEVCRLCHGTGLRDDELGRRARAEDPSYTCNSCNGEKTVLKWPTEWKRHSGDSCQIKDVEPGRLYHAWAVLRDDGSWSDRDKIPDDKEWMRTLTRALLKSGNWVTVIDCHV